ncbi:MAG: hypothetical protein HPY64_11860 [Anaerolineae bacterium]|nr:hypothetical protein [Anaerolineae bacterium]
MRKLSKIVALAVVLVLIGLLLPPLPAYADGGTPCPGSLPTRLAVGDTGEVARSFSSLRNSPGGLVIRVMYTGARFTVLEGPTCAGGLTFYKIDYGGGLVGWASESAVASPWGAQYWLAPVEDGGGTPTACAGSLAPRLAVGDTGRVARSFSSLRSSPGGPVISVRGYHEEFTVLEGPVCAAAGPLIWYRIDYGGGAVGWASESQVISPWGSQYWLEPAP